MNIDKQYAFQSAEDSRENNPLLPRNIRGLVIGRSGCGKTTAVFNLLLQPGWLDYNHLYVFGKSLHQQEYKVLRKCLDAGLSKHQISNLLSSHGALYRANISPLTAIEKCSGVRNGKIRVDVYDDCKDIPDPSAVIYSYRQTWKRPRISSLQQNCYRTKRCCTMKLPKIGMHSVIWMKWKVKNVTACD